MIATQPAAATSEVPVSATPKPAINGTTESNAAVAPAPIVQQQRLPHDKVGRLEDRIKEDPKADVEAWWELIQHYQEKDQLDNARAVYARMVEVWPSSPTIYLRHLTLETNSSFDRSRIDSLFSASLPIIPSLDLWTSYLSYVRRICPLIPDPTGQNRSTISAAFDAVLGVVGNDPNSHTLWREYIDFAKSGPGVLGGSGWQDLQKVDVVRKAYQAAVKVPSGGVIALWKEYDGFEMLHNKAGARKVLQEMSPHYMTARTAEKQLQRLTEGLDRSENAGVPTLPPLEGCAGDDAFAGQVARWRAWVEWEKADPLVLKDEDAVAWRARVLFVYKQATIYLRFWPRIWHEAAEWCFAQAVTAGEEMSAQGTRFLTEGLQANSESVLLTLSQADHLESAMGNHAGGEDGEREAIADGDKLEAVYEPCHVALYALVKKMQDRAKRTADEVKAYYAALPPEEEAAQDEDMRSEAGSDAPVVEQKKSRAEQEKEALRAVGAPIKMQQKALQKTVSALWIAKMRAFRRVQGQGAPNKPRKGFRGVFAEARPRGQLNADVYIVSALMEHHCYKDPSALKIFDRGMKLFSYDEEFAVAYVGHLININDLTNARVVLETTVTKILGAVKLFDERERKEKVRVLLAFMHRFESAYGDLAQVKKLETRMKELVPEGPEAGLAMGDDLFADRHAIQGFDATGVQLVLSTTQIKPKPIVPMPAMITMPDGGRVPVPMGPGSPPTAGSGLRLGPNGPFLAAASPKRPFDDFTDGDNTDGEGRARKMIRAESPLKAGRRGPSGHAASNSVTATSGGGSGGGGFMTKNFQPNGAGGGSGNVAPPPVLSLPGQITLLLQVLPPAHAWTQGSWNAERFVELCRDVELGSARLW